MTWPCGDPPLGKFVATPRRIEEAELMSQVNACVVLPQNALNDVA
jgi:hypothetical protein